MSTLKIIVTILLILTAVYTAVSIYIASTLTLPGESPVTFDKFKIGKNVSDVSFDATDKLKLKGWLFNGTNGKVIMFVHGAGNQNRANEVYGTPEIASYFLNKGYSILLFDLRGTGKSQFSRISFGEYESRDIAGAFQFLQTKGFSTQNVGIISDSLGAIAIIMAGKNLKNAGAIVLDSPATEVKSVVSNIMVNEHNVPRFLHPGIYFTAKFLYKIDVDSVRPIDFIANISNTPLLFLHGENDTLIPPVNTEILLSHVNKGQRVVFPGAKHVETFKTDPKLYKEAVGNFFTKNLK